MSTKTNITINFPSWTKKIGSLFDRQIPLITILGYHSIGSDWLYSVSEETFKNQITTLAKKYRFITLNDVYLHLTGQNEITDPSIVVTFDDGYADVLKVADFLEDKGIKPTIFLLSAAVMVDRKEIENELPLLSVDEIKKLIVKGWEIGCHSATHPDFLAMNDLETKREVVDAKSNLEDLIGHPVNYFSYPKGRYNNTIITAVETAGYLLGVSMDYEVITKESNKFTLPRMTVQERNKNSVIKL